MPRRSPSARSVLALLALSASACDDELLINAPVPRGSLTFEDLEAREEPLVVELPPSEIGVEVRVKLRVSSSGTAPLVVEGAELNETAACPARSAAFVLDDDDTVDGGDGIDPADDRRVDLTFTARDGAPACTALVIDTNDREVPRLRAVIHARGDAPALCGPGLVDFGDVVVGASHSEPVELVSCGTRAVALTALSLADGAAAAGFTLSAPYVAADAPIALEVGDAVTVHATLAPVDEGERNGAVDVVADNTFSVALTGAGVPAAGCALTALPDVVDYGAVALGTAATREIIVRNVGDAACAQLSVAVDGAAAPSFALESALPSTTLAPLALLPLAVTFTAPADAGAHDASLVVRSASGALDIALTALAVAPEPCTLSAAPAAVSFGSVDAASASSRTRDVAITSVGSATCRIDRVDVTPGFALLTPAPSTLNAGASASLTVAPSATHIVDGPMTGTLSVRYALDGSSDDARRLDVPLAAIGSAPRICVEPTSLSFGDVVPGSVSERSFTVRSCGSATLTLSSVAFVDGDAALSVGPLGALPFALAPGGAVDVVVRAAPQMANAGQALAGVVAVGSDDAASPVVNVDVSAQVGLPEACDASPSVLIISGPATGSNAPGTCASPPCLASGHWLERWFALSLIPSAIWEGESLAPSALQARGITQVWVVPPDGSFYGISDEELQNLLDFEGQGGSLVLLADNVPFISVSNDLADAYGVHFISSPLGDMGLMTRADGNIFGHCTMTGIDVMNAGITPSYVDFPDDPTHFALIAHVQNEHIMVAMDNTVDGRGRVIFDSAFTHYQFFTEGVAVGDWVRNVAFYGACGCDTAWSLGTCGAGPAECGAGTYSACTCDAADPCQWSGDGVCDATSCAMVNGADFDDGGDCDP